VSTDVITNRLKDLSKSQVLLLASRSLGNVIVEDTISWQFEPMNVLSIGNGTVGFWRLSGIASNGRESASWSTVLKVLNPSIFVEGMPRFQSARQELDALMSNDLSEITTGLRPAPVYDVEEDSYGNYWVWMKDLSGGIQPPWNAKQYIRTAEHVGQFGALWPESSPPSGDWYVTDGSTDRRVGITDLFGEGFNNLKSDRNHRFHRRIFDAVGENRVVSLLEMANTLIAATGSLPRSIAHNDCHARNLFPSEDNGAPITYGVDWASVGLAPIGVDGGSVAGAGLTWGQTEAMHCS
jgi:hypothetical protein